MVYKSFVLFILAVTTASLNAAIQVNQELCDAIRSRNLPRIEHILDDMNNNRPNPLSREE